MKKYLVYSFDDYDVYDDEDYDENWEDEVYE